jgi:hypothetical protein
MTQANIGDGQFHSELRPLERAFNLKFASYRNARSFTLEAESDKEALLVRVTLANSERSYFYPVEGRILHKDQNVTVDVSLAFLVEYIEGYFADYFEGEEDVYLPIDWKDFDCEGVSFQLRGQVQNLYLEAMADRLLAGDNVEAIASEKSRLGLH